jgi:hypothetical protein
MHILNFKGVYFVILNKPIDIINSLSTYSNDVSLILSKTIYCMTVLLNM